jgi:hypothetical protein
VPTVFESIFSPPDFPLGNVLFRQDGGGREHVRGHIALAVPGCRYEEGVEPLGILRAERLAFRRKRAWTMNTAPTAMTSQSHTLKPSSTPSATVRAMIKVKAATVAQFLTRDSDLATSSLRRSIRSEAFIAHQEAGAQPRSGYSDGGVWAPNGADT